MKYKPEKDWIIAWPLSGYYAAYVDPKKSVLHRNDKGQMENSMGYPFWIPDQRYLANVEDYIEVASEIEAVTHTINDPITKKPLIRFRVEKGKSGIFDGDPGNGMILFEYTPDLMSYRKREHGLLGIESLSGFDTRLGDAEYLKNPRKFPGPVLRTNNKQANFSGFDKID